MGDVDEWLERLGLSRYRSVFAEHDIDREILPDLTDQDLEKLGLSLGHRKKLLRAIAELPRPDSAAQQEPARKTAGRAEVGTREAPPREAERRQLTVLFCDLVGSTALAARLDPEDLRAVMRAYQAACAQVISHFEGHVAEYLGDGVLAYFGWPVAHEDDAERAVRAGLELVAAVSRLGEPEAKPDIAAPSAVAERRVALRSTRATVAGRPLAARIGIATGIAVVGDLIGEGAAREEAVVGETPNLAARLQALGAPGSVVISQATRRLVGGLFELEDLGPRRLRGFAEPLAAFRVAGEGRAEGRFEARQTSGLTPLVGRAEELALLLRRWRQARDREGQVVLLSGEPGIGKSRLVRELRARLADEPHVRLLYQCSPHHTSSPLHPMIEQLERAAGFARDDGAEAKLDKLAALLARGTNRPEQAVPLIAALLGVPTEGRYPALDLTPQRQKQLTLEALVDQLEGLARGQPVLLAYEDVHWIDPTTQELLGLAIQRIRSLPALLLITFRPEFTPPWSGQPHVSALALSRLGRREGAALVERVVKDKALPAEVAAQIAAKTDGVPLFVEELTKTVLESGLLRDAGDHYELSGPLPPLAIPATLHDSLMARLDRLTPVKEVAQIGAVIGREFSHDLLAAVSPLSAADLGFALDQLVASELVFRKASAPAASYSFKHALVQDTAYQSLLKTKRQELHGRIAHVLERDFPQTAETEPEILAHHFAEGRLAEAAIDYWCRAGRRAVERSSSKEAIAHLEQGIALLDTLPAAPEKVGMEIALRTLLGIALSQTEGASSPNVHQTYTRLRELCGQADDNLGLYAATWGLWYHYQYCVQFETAHNLSEELIALSCDQHDSGLVLQAHHAAWTTGLAMGALVSALEHAEQGQRLYDIVEHGSHAFRFGGHDPGVCSLCIGSWSRWLLGYPDQALIHAQDARLLGEKLSHPYSLGVALGFGSVLFQLCGYMERAREWATEAVSLGTELGYLNTSWNALARLMQGCVLATQGKSQQAHALGQEALQFHKNPIFRPCTLGGLSEIYLRSGEPERGLEVITEGLDTIAHTGERLWEAELHRLKGELMRASGAEISKVEDPLRFALQIAGRQGARSLELRAATSLARLWAEQGERRKAHDLLAPVYGWFTEGFDTQDLKDAKAVLDELA
jgi:class 3 adenylate cyclase